MNCDEKYMDGRASDFEWFALWEESLVLAEGHREVKRYEEELASVELPRPDAGTYSREESISRWRRLNIASNTGIFEGERENICVNGTCDIMNEKYKKLRHSFKFDVEKYVTEFTTKCDSVTALSKMLALCLDKCEIPHISLIIDINIAEYLRPDPYSARIAFEKEKSGEKLNIQEKNILLSQLLIELLIRMKNTKDISVLIRTGSNSPAALGLAEYLARRGIFEGEMVISVDEKTDLESFADVAEKVYPRVWLRPLIDTKKISDGGLKKMFSAYPSGAFLTDLTIF